MQVSNIEERNERNEANSAIICAYLVGMLGGWVNGEDQGLLHVVI
jgi:hypothetical protein